MVLTMLAACSGRSGNIPYDVQLGAPDSVEAQALRTIPLVRPGDKLNITVFQFPDLSGEYLVDVAGNVDMPLIGTVEAAGSSPADLRRRLEALYRESYLTDPTINVAVTQTTTPAITVEGSVRDPGVFEIDRELTLLQAVAMANGLDTYANPKKVVIFRQIDGRRAAAAFDLSAIRDGEMEDPQVFGNDIVVVDGSGLPGSIRDLIQFIPLIALFRFI